MLLAFVSQGLAQPWHGQYSDLGGGCCSPLSPRAWHSPGMVSTQTWGEGAARLCLPGPGTALAWSVLRPGGRRCSPFSSRAWHSPGAISTQTDKCGSEGARGQWVSTESLFRALVLEPQLPLRLSQLSG